MWIGRATRVAAFVLGLALLGPTAAPASFPGPNGPIYFTATAPGATDTDVWATDPAGGSPVNLTDLPGGAGSGRDPTASGDGSLIAFAVGPPGDSEVWTMAADGSSAHPITAPNGAVDDQPALSRGGGRIAFRTTRAGDEDIWTMAVDGSGAEPLLNQPGADREPQFAADGSVVVSSSELGGDLDIAAFPATGGPYAEITDPPTGDPRQAPQSVTYYSDADESAPAIKPDLSRVAYTIDAGGHSDIEDVFFNGTDFLPIAANPAISEFQPSFSPDGTKLVYGSSFGLMVAASGGANPTTLATGSAVAPVDPEWAVGESPDSSAPQTTISKRPANRGKRRKARYRVEASEPQSTFECKLDRRPFKPCSSPRKLKRLKPGRHRFKVRATDGAGNTDPSPARDRFRVVKPPA
jgi:hypothetical protein